MNGRMERLEPSGYCQGHKKSRPGTLQESKGIIAFLLITEVTKSFCFRLVLQGKQIQLDQNSF